MSKKSKIDQYSAYQRFMERRYNMVQKATHGMKMTPVALAVRKMFSKGLPYRWGQP